MCELGTIRFITQVNEIIYYGHSFSHVIDKTMVGQQLQKLNHCTGCRAWSLPLPKCGGSTGKRLPFLQDCITCVLYICMNLQFSSNFDLTSSSKINLKSAVICTVVFSMYGGLFYFIHGWQMLPVHFRSFVEWHNFNRGKMPPSNGCPCCLMLLDLTTACHCKNVIRISIGIFIENWSKFKLEPIGSNSEVMR